MVQYGDAMNGQKKQHSGILSYCKLAAAFLMMFAMAYVFTFYLDGDIGVVIWSFLLIAPILSFLLAFLARRHIRASLQAPVYIAKGKRFSANVQLNADGFLPIPFLRLELQQTANFQPEDARCIQTSLSPKAPERIAYELTARYAGSGGVSLESVHVTDYLGLLSLPVQGFPHYVKIGVIPEIPSLTGAGVMLHTVSDVVLTQDDEEEESAAAFSSMSMPGYVHRDYVEGDSLRRINWKLSAKRGRLMVRMDEAASAVRPTVILDLRQAETEDALRMRETLMEGALGFLILLVRQGIPCSIRFASEGSWKHLILESEDAVREAAVELGAADFRNDGSRLDREALMERAGAFLIYTADPDPVLAAEMAEFHDHGYLCCVVPDCLQTESIPHADAVWTLSADHTMTALQK